MKYLVTGDCGFIGGNIAERLIKDGHMVFGYDNYSSSSRKDRIAGVKALSEADGLDGIFHLGMASSSPMYEANPLVITKSVRTTLKVLNLARVYGCPVVFASSSSLYNGNPVPYNEMQTIWVNDLYTETRFFIERLFESYYKQYNIPSIGLRLFSVFGPRDKKKGKYANNITQFILNLVYDEKLVLYGDGKQTRDFIHVNRVVEAFMKSMKILRCSRLTHPHMILNIGSGRSMSFNEIITWLNELMNKSIRPEHIKNPIKAYVKHTLADTHRMKEKLGMDPDKFEFLTDLRIHIEQLWNP